VPSSFALTGMALLFSAGTLIARSSKGVRASSFSGRHGDATFIQAASRRHSSSCVSRAFSCSSVICRTLTSASSNNLFP
jgi:hypothetical protein